MFGSYAAWGPGTGLQDGPATSVPAPAKVATFKPRDRVIYVPHHANGNRNHPDCEHGRVSSVNDKYVFVRFDEQVRVLGWDQATGKACDPADLVTEMMSDL